MKQTVASSSRDCWSWLCIVIFVAVLATCGGVAAAQPAEENPSAGIEIATFSCDLTPPLGHPLCGGTIKPVAAVDEPELAKGVILRDAGGVYVLCAVDWCELRNETHDAFAKALAIGAGTTPARVAVQCVHQHDAPIADAGAQKLLRVEKGAPIHAQLAFLEEAAERLGAAAREAVKHWRRATEIGVGKAKAERIASNRRVRAEDGSISVRWSSVKDAKLHEAPEGLIDPWVRTIGFYDGEKPLAHLHYYATHPQSHYGDGRATWDVPGIARERLEKETGAFQVYFTGCAGDITMGKYNDGEHARRGELAGRLHDAMKRSIDSISRRPIGPEAAPIKWKSVPVTFPLRGEDEYSGKSWRAALPNAAAAPATRIEAAIGLAWINRVNAGKPVELSRLAIGDVRILHLPGEPFVQFQLYAQSLRPEAFVAVAGYGDGGPGYICAESAFAEGGYEPTASLVAPKSEGILKEAIELLLADPASAQESAVEAFDSDPGWIGINNAPPAGICQTIRQDFGWNPPGAAGGKPGSIGGSIQRSVTQANYSRAVGPFTLADRLSASGRFRVEKSQGNSGALIGWFNANSRGWRTPNSLFFRFDGADGAYRVFFEYGTQNGKTGGGQTFEGRYQENPKSLHPADGRDHEWRLDYDPAAAEGRGEIAFTMDGVVYREPLEAGHKGDGAAFDRFGIMNVAVSGASMSVEIDGLLINGEPQNLATNPGWESVRSRETYEDCIVRPYHSFGWRPTARAGGAPGEIGGIVWRIEAKQLEQSLVYSRGVEPVNAGQPLAASGKIAFVSSAVDSAMLVGWHDSKNPRGSPPPGFIGILIEGPSRVGHYIRPILGLPDGRFLLPEEGPILTPDSKPREWTFRYDPPTAAAPGKLAVTLGEERVEFPVPPSAAAEPPPLDSFGVLSWGQGGHFVEIYLDDLRLAAAKAD